jgi:hypothetical protein
MALGNSNIPYTPFQETSFGYGSTELATNYYEITGFQNSTDIVKIVIQHLSGNWDDTGHISTPSSGTAVSVYDPTTKIFTVRGQRSDVDVVLSQLTFYPADNPASRPYAADNTNGFKTLLFKQNQTTGNYGSAENPPAIGDTTFEAVGYDANNVSRITGTIIFNPTEPTTGNQRPFFATAPAHQDYSTNTYDQSTGAVLDFGVLDHGSDTENVTVKGFFAPYSSSDTTIDLNGEIETTFIPDTSLGSFANLNDLYIGNKLASTPSQFEKFNFTGSVTEAQAFLDNLKYKTLNSAQDKTFNMHVTVDDGVTGSVLIKTMYHAKALTVSTLPTTQTFKEDNTAVFDLGSVIFGNIDEMPEVNSFKAVITLDSTGKGGATSFGTTTTVDTDSYNASTGVLTIVHDNLATFKQAIRNLEFVPVTDFNSSFTFTVVFTFENSTIGSSYASASQTINVTGQESSEVENISVTHNYTEDQVYYFKDNTPLQIIHPINQAFKVDFNYTIDSRTISQVGDLNTTNTDVTKTTVGNTITFTGTRDQLNDALENLRFEPFTDVDLSFPINVTVTRTGGDLTFETPSTGQFSMVGNAQTEFTFTAPEKIVWAEDTTVRFDNGLEILDTSLEDPLLPAFGGSYKFTARAKYADGTSVNSSDIAFTCDSALDATVSGTGTVADPLIITGSRVDINHAVQNFVMTPKADFTAAQEFRFEYQLERGLITDSYYALYLNFNQSTSFDSGTPSAELEVSANNLKYGTDTIADLGNTYRIVDAAVDKEYTVTFTMDSNAPGILRATAIGDATVEYVTADKRLICRGTKVDLNNVFRTLEYLPTLGSTNDITIAYFQKQRTDTITQAAGSDTFTLFHDPSVPKFTLDTTNQNLFYAEDLQDQEDILAFTNLKITDATEELLAGTGKTVHYVIEMTLNPTTEIFFFRDYAESGVLADGIVEEKASSITFTGSKAFCNEKIKSLKFSGNPDQVDDVAIVYSQSRYIDNKFSELQADAVTALTLRAQSGGSAEAVFSTDLQFFTVNSAVGENNEVVNPHFLHTSFTSTTYKPPVVIIDSAVESGGPTLYKLEVISSNLPTGVTIADITFKTKADFKEAISNGIVPQNVSDSFVESLQYGSEYEVHFKLTRRLGNGTEAEIEFDKLTYKFITPPQVFEFKDTTPTVRISTNTIDYNQSTHARIKGRDPQDVTVIGEDILDRYFFGYVKKDTGTNEFYGTDIGTDLKSLTFTEISQDGFSLREQSETSEISYNPFNNPLVTSFTNTYKTFTPNSFGGTEVSKAEHVCIDKFGLKTTLTINYSEIGIKYTNSFREGHASNTNTLNVYAHHTGDQDGAFTITSMNGLYPDISANTNLEDNNFVKVSNYWMSENDIGSNIGNFETLDESRFTPRNVTSGSRRTGRLTYTPSSNYPNDIQYSNYETSVKSVTNFGFKVQQVGPYKSPYGTHVNADWAFRTGFQGLQGEYDFGVHLPDGLRTSIVFTYGIGSDKPEQFFMNRVDTFIKSTRGKEGAKPGGNDFLIKLDKLATHLHTVSNPTTQKTRGYFFHTHDMEQTKNWFGNRISPSGPFPVMLHIKEGYDFLTGDGINFGDPESYVDNITNWFEPPRSYDSQPTYDFEVDSSDLNNVKILLVKSFIRDFGVPTSGFDQIFGRYIINEAMVLKQNPDNTFTQLSFHRTQSKPSAKGDVYVHGVPSSNTNITPGQNIFTAPDYDRWARRHGTDNVPRIKVYNGKFVLPTGHVIQPKETVPTEDVFLRLSEDEYSLTKANSIFGTDIVGKLIDQYIIMPDNKLAYVSAGDGIIANPKEGINIRLDNNRFDYIYITNDGINTFDFYGVMAKAGARNTVNQTPFPGFAKKLFMFKALGKL